MWRTALYKKAALLRHSSGHGSSRIFSVHVAGHECSDCNVRPTVKDQQNVVINQNLANAQNTIVGLLVKLHDGNFNEKHTLKVESHVPFVQNILDDISGLTELASVNRNCDLTSCTPKTKRRSQKRSGFGFKFVFQDFKKWCYGVVVVSSLISWHRLLLKNERRNNNDHYELFLNDNGPPRILPLNSAVTPIDPLDAACSSLESAVTYSTAVTENGLGMTYLNLKSYKTAYTYFLSSSKKGNVSAHFNMGLCFEKGLGTTQDISKAVCSYGVAASHGHQDAAFNLGLIFLEGKYHSGKDRYGLEMVEKAAIGGLVKAQQFLGLYYADDSNKHYDMKKSFHWLKMASEQNDAKAQYHLGICYERGLGVARNMQKAKEMYGRGAENGHAGAQYNYGVFYEQGLGGLSVDKHEALRWYTTAVENGNVNAEEKVKSLQTEVRAGKKTPNLHKISHIRYFEQPKSKDGVMPRCSSSPGGLFMQSESTEFTQGNRAGNEKSISSYEDSKCIWVI